MPPNPYADQGIAELEEYLKKIRRLQLEVDALSRPTEGDR